MPLNVLDIFSEALAVFGFLKFEYPDEASGNVNGEFDEDVKSNDKSNRLSSVSRFNCCAAFDKSTSNTMFISSSTKCLILIAMLVFDPLSLHLGSSLSTNCCLSSRIILIFFLWMTLRRNMYSNRVRNRFYVNSGIAIP